MNGHFEMVRWLHVHRAEEGCITSAIDGAARNRLFVIVRWLQQAHDTVSVVVAPPTPDGLHSDN
jgi:aromatic ring-cleaving dioxygenase